MLGGRSFCVSCLAGLAMGGLGNAWLWVICSFAGSELSESRSLFVGYVFVENNNCM